MGVGTLLAWLNCCFRTVSHDYRRAFRRSFARRGQFRCTAPSTGDPPPHNSRSRFLARPCAVEDSLTRLVCPRRHVRECWSCGYAALLTPPQASERAFRLAVHDVKRRLPFGFGLVALDGRVHSPSRILVANLSGRRIDYRSIPHHDAPQIFFMGNCG
jgi:hypothetical protein